MAISEDDVRYVARLARLDLSDQEVSVMREQLSKILEHASRVSLLATEGVAPTSHAIPLSNVFRPDEVEDPLSVEEALANAPEREDGMFRVPRILEEESA